jgi:hypothetical protein
MLLFDGIVVVVSLDGLFVIDGLLVTVGNVEGNLVTVGMLDILGIYVGRLLVDGSNDGYTVGRIVVFVVVIDGNNDGIAVVSSLLLLLLPATTIDEVDSLPSAATVVTVPSNPLSEDEDEYAAVVAVLRTNVNTNIPTINATAVTRTTLTRFEEVAIRLDNPPK